ncbi:MAG: InlB B-repeat-containing protein, partial [Defluviitaleaceae bacterium]|nr:InlB B-repeat-containing protein [Defluviitaleaceae bacterium]
DDESLMVFDFDGLEWLEDFESPYEIFFYDDLPEICASYWLEDDLLEYDIFHPYDLLMPFNATPSLTVSHSNLTSNSVTLHGTVNPNGVNINMRGFWIRSDNEVNAREIRATGASNSFSSAVSGLRPNTVYHVRSIARRPGQVSAAYQSQSITFRTPQAQPTINVPSMPLGLRITPGVGQVTLHWSPPSNNGGAAIQRYEVALNNGAWMPAQSMSSHTFSISGNDQQTFRVRAVNSAGAGTQASIQGMPLPPNTQTPPPQTPPPANHPTLTLTIRNITSSTATLVGTVTPNGANITMRGFWFRRDNQATHQEVIVNTSSNTFEITITDLTPNTNFYVRAVARASGITGTHQSPAGHFRTQAPPSGPPVTVTFNANGGIGGTTREVRVGNIVGALPPNPTRANHTFGGWFTAQIGGTQVNANTIVQGAVTYWARWNSRIDLNANGGTGVPAFITIQSATSAPLPTPTRDGHIFLGWSVTPQVIVPLDASIEPDLFDPSAFEYELGLYTVDMYELQEGIDSQLPIAPANASFIIGSFTAAGHITLHAHWRRAHTITFDYNGGVVTEPRRSVPHGDPIGDLPLPRRTGADFDGWFTTEGVRIRPTDEVTANMTLRARWTVTITFNPVGGHVSQANSTRTVAPGSLMTGGAFPTPTRQGRTFGHRFVGWYDAIVGGNRITASSLTPNSHTTLFARWELAIDTARHLPYWYHSTGITLRNFEIYSSLSANWQPAMMSGVTGWNNSNTPIGFLVSSASNNEVIAEPRRGRHEVAFLGWLEGEVVPGHQLIRFEIVLNSYSIIPYARSIGRDLYEAVTTVMLHELGHAIGLRDNPPVNRIASNSVMGWWCVEDRILIPTHYDVDSVNMIFAPIWPMP